MDSSLCCQSDDRTKKQGNQKKKGDLSKETSTEKEKERKRKREKEREREKQSETVIFKRSKQGRGNNGVKIDR